MSQVSQSDKGWAVPGTLPRTAKATGLNLTPTQWLVTAAFVVYAVWLVSVEWRMSQDHVRHYFTDITGPVFFYAVNTTLSAGLLAAGALLFAVTAAVARIAGDDPRVRTFALIEMAIFTYLALDDRFLIHEHLVRRYDAVFFAGLGVLHLAVLWRYRALLLDRPATWLPLAAAAAGFAVMVVIDGLAPRHARLRLSFEDLAKSGACLMLAFFAWAFVRTEIARCVSRPSAAATQPHTARRAETADAATIALTIPGATVVRIAWASIALAMLGGCVAAAIPLLTGRGSLLGIIQLFDLDMESNVPTFVSALLMIACSLLLGLLARRAMGDGDRHRWRWTVLAGAMLFMAMDELTQIHEKATVPVRVLLNLEGTVLHYAWVVPGVMVVAITGVWCWPLLRSLPRAIGVRLVLAAGVFLGGAVGMETVGGTLVVTYGDEHAASVIAAVIEESMELAGLVMLLHTLILMLRGEERPFVIRFA